MKACPCGASFPCAHDDAGYPWCTRCLSHHRHPETCGQDDGEDCALDPRWEWVEVQYISDAHPQYIRGRCRHLEVILVESVEGEIVARLCRTCDTQLPAEWRP